MAIVPIRNLGGGGGGSTSVFYLYKKGTENVPIITSGFSYGSATLVSATKNQDNIEFPTSLSSSQWSGICTNNVVGITNYSQITVVTDLGNATVDISSRSGDVYIIIGKFGSASNRLYLVGVNSKNATSSNVIFDSALGSFSNAQYIYKIYMS